jgi:hypothetical protein
MLDQFALAERFLETLHDAMDSLPVPEWQMEILRERIAEHERNPQAGIPLERFLKKLEEKYPSTEASATDELFPPMTAVASSAFPKADIYSLGVKTRLKVVRELIDRLRQRTFLPDFPEWRVGLIESGLAMFDEAETGGYVISD